MNLSSDLNIKDIRDLIYLARVRKEVRNEPNTLLFKLENMLQKRIRDLSVEYEQVKQNTTIYNKLKD